MTASAEEQYLVVEGRRRRRSDPSIPDKLRVELVAELMDARRAVGAALRAADDTAGRAARRRVQAAKLALGERGEPSWEAPTEAGRTTRIRATIDALLAHRDGGSICPSDVARVVGGAAWRNAMPAVRAAAFTDARRGKVVVRQGGNDVDPAVLDDVRGPIRIARAG